ncbi:MAG: NlpC/P60 family protein [Pseudomonadota bacterium]
MDRRITAARPDLAARHLEGLVEAERFVEGEAMRVGVPRLGLRLDCSKTAAYDSELLYGEPFTVYDERDSLAWGQSGWDGYVGWVRAEALEPAEPTDHHVCVPVAQLYAGPGLKQAPVGEVPFLARVAVTAQEGRWVEVDGRAWMSGRHLRAGAPDAKDWVAVAEAMLGAPYLWGGRTPLGLDCSALVQLARMAAGHICPRDSDMQMEEGRAVEGPLRRGDLMFWKGHVGILRDAETLLHANAFHMACVSEPLELAVDRIAAQGDGPVTATRRFR